LRLEDRRSRAFEQRIKSPIGLLLFGVGFGFVLNAWDQRPLEWRSAIVRAQNTSEGYSGRFCGVWVIQTIVVTAHRQAFDEDNGTHTTL
jgi:hypothetical protein